MGALIKFPGNARPTSRQETPATVIILPIIRIERYSPAELAAKLKRLRRARLMRKGLGK